MSFRHLKDFISIQDNSKTKIRCLEDVLRWLGYYIKILLIMGLKDKLKRFILKFLANFFSNPAIFQNSYFLKKCFKAAS